MIYLERKNFTVVVEDENKKYYAAVVPPANANDAVIFTDNKLIIVLEIVDGNSDSPAVMYFENLSDWIQSFLGIDWLEEQILLSGVLAITKEWEQY